MTFDVAGLGPEDGRPIIFLHGSPENNTMWAEAMSALAEAGHRCVAPDQRGYSSDARPEEVSAYATAALAADVIALADHFDWDRFDLVGHDWGAGVAWRVAAQYPQRLRTLNVLSVGNPDAISALLAEGVGDQRERSSYIGFFVEPDSSAQLMSDDVRRFRELFRGWGPVDEATITTSRISPNRAVSTPH